MEESKQMREPVVPSNGENEQEYIVKTVPQVKVISKITEILNDNEFSDNQKVAILKVYLGGWLTHR